jgi:hypothetical protein
MFHNYEQEDDRFMRAWLIQFVVQAPDARVTLDDLLEAYKRSLLADSRPVMNEDDFQAAMLHNWPELPTEVQGLRKRLVYLGLRLRSTPSRPAEELAREKEQANAVQDAWVAEMKAAVKACDEPRAVALAQRMIRMQEAWPKRANPPDKKG